MTAPDDSPDHAPAFDGLRVIDATQGIGGPYTAMLLADHGADVIKVEPPGGDRQRGTPAFHVVNRGKRGVVLDLETAAGRADLRRLVAGADVFLYDWTPGEDARLGFEPEALRAAQPRLIVGYLPAYGSRGPHADLPPDEALVQAVSAANDAQYRYDEPPVFLNLPLAGYAQAIVASNAVAATLYARARGGRGDSFEVSGVSAIFAMQTIAYLEGDAVMRRSGRVDPHGPIPTYRLVRASDDWLFAGALTPGFWASMAVAAGLEDCLVDPRFAGAPMAVADPDDRAELARRVDAAYTARPRDEWLRILEEANVPRGPVLSREEFARDEQVAHNGMMIDLDDPELGRTRQMNVAVWLRDTPGRVRGPAPRLGEHQALLRQEQTTDSRQQGAAREQTADSRQQSAPATHRAPLDGVTIVDLTGFIAGASGSMLLADMGADVIKVESLDGDGWRTSGLAFLGCNRGKRGIAIDLKRPEGRDLVLELAARADVVMDNFRAGVMDRLGLTWDALRARNPRLIHCSVTGYGPDGPYAHLPGFDPLFQARSGLMRAQGEPHGEPVYLQISLCDYTTALSAAYGVMAALSARERTGRGQRVETCLLNSAFTVQAGEFIFYEGRPDDPPGGRDLRGLHALYRIYDAADGSLTIACTTPEHAARAADALGVALPLGDALTHDRYGDVAGEIATLLEHRPRAHWLSLLRGAGVPAAPCVTIMETFADEHLAANDLWWEADYPRWGHLKQPGAAVRWHDRPMRLGPRAPGLGEHTTEVLRQFGVRDDRIASLLASSVVAQR